METNKKTKDGNKWNRKENPKNKIKSWLFEKTNKIENAFPKINFKKYR